MLRVQSDLGMMNKFKRGIDYGRGPEILNSKSVWTAK